MEPPRLSRIAGVPVSKLSRLRVSHVPDEHLPTLDLLLRELGSEPSELSEDRNLSFLAEIYLSEKMKGKKADRNALAKIEAIVVSANAFSGPKVYYSSGGGGGGSPQKHHPNQLATFTEQAMGRIAQKSSNIYHRIPSKKAPDGANYALTRSFN